ncbi:hypothetical protein SAMD00019534_096330, partial [Acytostelium subglobosum LB1]|uniref:hypothetical protein n=1 Tax=Acytostelium subglobosum LB1 TaxID=1410327 RepID=UPI000644D41C
ALSNRKNKRRIKTLLVGLDNAGKTTMLYRMMDYSVDDQLSFVENGIEFVTYNNLDIFTWDLGGSTKYGHRWREHYKTTDALIYVLDSTDTDRINEVFEELKKICCDLKPFVPVLIMLNKLDINSGSSSPSSSISVELINVYMSSILATWQFHCQPSVATRGEGIQEGLAWLDRALIELDSRKEA